HSDRIAEVSVGDDRVRLPLLRRHARRPFRLPRDAPGTPRPGRCHHRHERRTGVDMTVSSAMTFPDLEAGLVEWAADHPALKADDTRLCFSHVCDDLTRMYAKLVSMPLPAHGVGWWAVS